MKLFAILMTIFSASCLALSKDSNVSQLPLIEFSSGEEITLIAGGDSVIYLDFWASWCKPCAKSFPFMNQLHQDYSAKGLKVVAVNLDEDVEDAIRFLSAHPAQFSIYRDRQNALAKQFKLPGLPVSYLIDKNGKVKAIHKGFTSSKSSKIEAQINYLLEQK